MLTTLFSARTLRNTLSCFALLLTGACLASGEEKTVTVNDPRPVAAAIEKIEILYVVPITYEDPPYVHDSQISDVTEQVSRDPQSGNRVLIPKGGTLSFTYEVPPPNAMPEARRALAALAVNKMLRAYNADHHADMFTLLEGVDILHVIPLRFINAAGVPEQISPLLSTSVSFVPERAKGDYVLSALTANLSSKTGTPVLMPPLAGRDIFSDHLTTISASNEPARSVLDRLLKEVPIGYTSKPDQWGGTHLVRGGSLSWELFCDPAPASGCFLNLYMVVPEGRQPAVLEGGRPELIRGDDEP